MQDFKAPVFVLVVVKFPRVFVPYEAKESSYGQSGYADFKYNISFFDQDILRGHTMKICRVKR